jgi:hypothetical protein
MKMKIILFVILVALVAFVLWPPTKIQEKYEAPSTVTKDPGYSEEKATTVATPDELEKIIRSTQKALSQKIGKCTYCIETTNVELVGNTYNGRFLFTVLPENGGGAYGVSVNSKVNKDSYQASDIELQSLNTIDAVDPYQQFKSGSEISEATMPKLADLQLALQSM